MISLLLAALEPPPASMPEQISLEAQEQACVEKHGAENEQAIMDCLGIIDPLTIPIEELREGIEQRHPYEMMMLAARYFHQEANKPEGLFWFYASQLRWRARLSCHTLEPSGEPALWSSMFSMIGSDINGWAAENTDLWLSTLDAVHAWDVRTPGRYEGDIGCDAQIAEQRQGLLELRNHVESKREELESMAKQRESDSEQTQ